MFFSGLVEYHVTVDPENNYINLWSYTKNNDCKLIYACSKTGEFPNQYMISKFSNKKSFEEMISKLTSIKEKISNEGIKIVRSKIELMMSCEGVPKTKVDYDNLVSKLPHKPYFEFHVKFNDADYDTVHEICKKYEQTAISVNICGHTKNILLTIRRYTFFEEAVKDKDEILNYFKSIGYKFKEDIQQEFCIYDDNVELDSGWLV